MNINRAQSMFGKMANAQIRTSREDMEEGRYVILINSITNKESRQFKPYMKVTGTILYPICDGIGRTPEMDLCEVSPAGSPAEWVITAGDYFANEVITLLTKCLDISKEELEEMKKGMSTEEFNKEFFNYCLEMTGEEVQGTETVRVRNGCFDNTTAVEIKVTKSSPKPKPNAEDNTPGKVYTNAKVLRKVPMSEVSSKVTEESDIIRFFGSVDHFAELIESESK